MPSNGVSKTMAFNVGDVVHLCTRDAIHCSDTARIQEVLPRRYSTEDFQEYVVEFPVAKSERLRFCLFREFELTREEG